MSRDRTAAAKKKKEQLGMDPGTASHKLVKDILWSFVSRHNPLCHRCQQPLARETFSIDHIIPWLDAADPLAMFFALDNISYSHLFCNVADARRPKRINEAEFHKLPRAAQVRLLSNRRQDERRRGTRKTMAERRAA